MEALLSKNLSNNNRSPLPGGGQEGRLVRGGIGSGSAPSRAIPLGSGCFGRFLGSTLEGQSVVGGSFLNRKGGTVVPSVFVGFDLFALWSAAVD